MVKYDVDAAVDGLRQFRGNELKINNSLSSILEIIARCLRKQLIQLNSQFLECRRRNTTRPDRVRGPGDETTKLEVLRPPLAWSNAMEQEAKIEAVVRRISAR